MVLKTTNNTQKTAEAPRRRVETFLFQQDGHLLAGRTEHGLAFPGGGCEAGESGAESARREIEEETGMRSSVVRLPFQGRVLERKEAPQQAPLPSLASSDAPRSDKSQTTYYLGRLLGTRVSSIGVEGDGMTLVSIHPTSMIAQLEQRAKDASNPFRAHDAERLEALKKALSILGRNKASTPDAHAQAVSSLSQARKREGRELRSLFPQSTSKQRGSPDAPDAKTANAHQDRLKTLDEKKAHVAQGDEMNAFYGSLRQMRNDMERDRFAKHAASFLKRPEVLGATLGAALGGASAAREENLRAEEVAKRLIGGGLMGGGAAHIGRLAQLVARGVQSQTKVDPLMRVLHAAATHLPTPLAVGAVGGTLTGGLHGLAKGLS